MSPLAPHQMWNIVDSRNTVGNGLTPGCNARKDPDAVSTPRCEF